MKTRFKEVILTKPSGHIVRVEPVASAIFVTDQGDRWEITTDKNGAVGCRLMKEDDK